MFYSYYFLHKLEEGLKVFAHYIEKLTSCVYMGIGAGFRSKLNYESGWFHMMMKIPEQKTGGLIPNFYVMILQLSTLREITQNLFTCFS